MNSTCRYLQLIVLGLVAVADPEARGQTNNPPIAPSGTTNSSGAAGSGGPTNTPAGTNVTALGETTVTGHLDKARTQIMPELGATVSVKGEAQLLSLSQGEAAPVSQIITRFPGVAADSVEDVVDDENVDLNAVLGGNVRKAPSAATEPEAETEPEHIATGA